MREEEKAGVEEEEMAEIRLEDMQSMPLAGLGFCPTRPENA